MEGFFMLLSNYYTTELEDWVTNFYLRLRILHPKQLKIDYIARLNEIFITRKPLPSFHKVIGRYRGIFLDSRQSDLIQREMFFHELCHILRHVGVQSKMPSSFRDLQEWDAKLFTSYAAIPYHMLRFIDFEQNNVVTNTAQLFQVTEELAEERLLQIKSRTIWKGVVNNGIH
jgi:hypothetical protein